MKLLSEHLGETIVAIAIVCLLITSVAFFVTPVEGFFTNIVESAFASKPSEPDNGGTPVVPPESACEHTNKETQNAKAATCTEDGSTGKVVCLDCGNTITSASVIPATGHQNTEVRNASETYSGDTYCLDCGVKVSSGHVIDASCQHSNTYHDHYDGNCYLICGDCGDTVSEYHDCGITVDFVEASCEEDGYTGDMYCENCNELLYEGEVIPATGHQNTEIRNASASYSGDTYCLDCGALVSSGSVIGPCDHSNSCSFVHENGDCLTYCDDCGELVSESYDTEIIVGAVAATCTTDGYTGDIYCSNEYCKALLAEGEVIPASGHTEGEWEYYNETYCREVCPDCGKQLASWYHQWEETSGKSATCTEDGMSYVDCTVCGAQGEFVIPATGHQNTEIRNASSSYSGDKYCLDCGKLLIAGSTIVPSCEHENTHLVGEEEVSCTSRGYTGDIVCLDCGIIVSVGHYINMAPLGHEYGNVMHPYNCTRCGHHKYAGIVITPAS